MTDERIAELLGWPKGRAHRDSSLMHRIRIVVAEAQAEQDGHIYRLREQIARDTAQIERLRAELAEAKRDADRHRWLRGDSCADHSVRWTQWEVRCWRAPIWSHDLRRTNLDEEIDAALCKENTDAR